MPHLSAIYRCLLNAPQAAASTPWSPDPLDPDLHTWYKASETYFVNTSINDKCALTVDNTTPVAPNMPAANVSGSYTIFPSGSLTSANYQMASADLQPSMWKLADCVVNDATHCTFGAQNGRILQYHYHMLPSETWQVTVTMRAVSGNLNLEVLHQDSATGTATAITVTNSLAEYTVTFAGPAAIDTLVRVGIRDPNAAGFGQIEVTKFHLRRTEHSGAYVATDTTNLYRQGGARSSVLNFGTPSGGTYGTAYGNPANRVNGSPFSIYVALWPHQVGASSWALICDTPTLWGVVIKTHTDGTIGFYTNSTWYYSAAPNTVTARTWQIWTIIHNNTNSEIRVNKNAATALNFAATPACNGWSFGSGYGGGKGFYDFHEIIQYYSAHNTATQDQIIDYLAAQIGIVV